MLGPTRGLRSSSLLLSSVALALLLQPACGSEDAKKKSPIPNQTGGSAGKGGSSGASGSGGTSGKSGEGGEGGTDAPDSGGTGGDNLGGDTGTGGASGAGGEGGASGPSCTSGTADCDDDPTDCEADVTTLTQCGACNVVCQATNGTVICGDTGCEMTSCTAGFGDCNQSGTDGCETALDTADNCGICDRSCGAAACTSGFCESTQVGSPIAGAYRWAMTADALYRLYGSTPGYGLPTTYTLVRTPLDGSAEVIMASASQSPGGLAVDDNYVYWAINGTPPAVFRKAHTASAVTSPTLVFEPASVPVQLRMEGAGMYWTALNGIIYTRPMSAPLGTNPGAAIVSASEVAGTGVFNLHQDLVTTPTVMYWVVLPASGQEAMIRTAPLAGGTAANVPGAITSPWLKLSVVGEDLYWARATGAASDGVYHFVKDGAVASLLVQPYLDAVLADGAYLYMLSNQANSLYRAQISGENAVKIGAGTPGVYYLDFLGSDPERVYVTTPFTHGAGFFTGGHPAISFPK